MNTFLKNYGFVNYVILMLTTLKSEREDKKSLLCNYRDADASTF